MISRRKHFNFYYMLLILFYSTFDLCNLIGSVQDNQTGIFCSNLSFQLQPMTGKQIKSLTQLPRAARPMQNSKHMKMQNGV